MYLILITNTNSVISKFLFTLLLIIMLGSNSIFAQLTGTKNIPGDYATLELAIADLNAVGVGTGGVTLNLVAANPQTAPAGGYVIGGTGSLVLTTTSSTNQIILQGNGNSITAFAPQTAGALNDAIFKLIGADWITIASFTALENPANTITAAGTNDMTEWGIALVYATTIDGAQNNTISGNTIDLNRTYQNTFGVYSNSTHSPTAVTTSATATGALGGNHNLIIQSNNITDVNLGIVAVGPTAAADMNNVMNIGGSAPTGNTITNFGTTGTFSAYANVSGTVNGILIRNTLNYVVSHNTVTSSIGGVTAGTLNGIQQPAFSIAPTGITFTNSINNNSISLQSGVIAGAMNGINCPSGSASTTSTMNINNNNFHTFGHTVAGTAAITFIINASTHLNQTISNNTFTNITVNTTGSVTFISNSNSLPAGGLKNVTNNSIVIAFSKTGASGTVTFFFDNAVDPSTATNNTTDNTFSNATFTGATTIIGIQNTNGGSPIKNVTGNVVENITGGTAAFTGMSINFDGGPTTVAGNNVTNVTNGGVINGILFGTSSAGTTNAYQNIVHSLTGTGTGLVNGLAVGGSAAGTRNIFKHNIYNLENNNTGGAANGILISSGTVNAYNNFISDVRAPNCNLATDGVRGISITSTTAASSVRLYYNTIFLKSISVGTDFSTSGIFHTNSTTATTAALDLRNNIVVNNSTFNGTGVTVAFRRSAANPTLDNYSTLSNNNDFYAGTPGIQNLIFFDGTNSDQTIGDFKTRVTPREAASFSENSPFVNTTSTPYNLHLNTTIATQTESGGTPITAPIAVTDDFESDLRNVTTPDVGADEFNGIGLDLIAPAIVYTPFQSTSSTSARTLFANVSDASGVPTSGIGLPVLYWRINAGTYSAAQGVYVSGSQYSFTFGAGVIIGDVVSYYIAAQDNSTPPNVGVFPSGGASGFTPNPPAAATPPTSPSTYVITDASLSGNYTVGITLFNSVTGRNISFEKLVKKVLKEVTVENFNDMQSPVDREKLNENELTEISSVVSGSKQLIEVEDISWIPLENGRIYDGDLFVKKSEYPSLPFPENVDGIYLTITAAVADLNLRGVSGPTNFLLTDATYPTETFPIVINVTNEFVPTAVNTVTIKPNTGVTSVISGSSPASQIFRIAKTNYITIDGSNSVGTSRDLTIENTSITTPQVIVIGSVGTTPVTGNTVKNCVIVNGVNSSSAVIVSDANAPGTAGWFNNITIQNNSIQKAYIANYNITVISPGNGTGLLINGNDFSTPGANSIRLVSVYVQGVDGATVSNNTIGNVANTIDATNITGVWFATGTINSTISNNTINNMSGTAGSPRGIAVSSALANANVMITNNTISGLTSGSTATTTGIFIFSTTSGVTAHNNIINNIKNTNATGFGCNGLQLASTLNPANVLAYNNLIYDIAAFGFAGIGVADNGYGIIVTAGAGYGIYYNSVYLTTDQTLVGGRPGAINVTSGVTVAGAIDLRDNIFANIQTVGDNRYSIVSGAAASVFVNINYNNYFTLAPNIGFIGGALVLDLAAWRIATGQDVNSISGDPLFQSITDLRPSMGSPVVDAGTPIAGITTDFLGATRNSTTPTMGAYEEPVIVPLAAGDYTVGVTLFRLLSGMDITFEKRTRTIEINELTDDSYVSPEQSELNTAAKDELISDGSIDKPFSNMIERTSELTTGNIFLAQQIESIVRLNESENKNVSTKTIKQDYFVPILNGKEYFGSLYHEFTPEEKSNYQLKGAGVYATITEAKNDAMLRGIAGPIRFILLDATYPSETFPIVINEIPGASSTNTVTLMPDVGVTSLISGTPTNTTILDLNGLDYFIFDGRSGGVGETINLTIENLATTGTASHTVRLINGATNNILRYVRLNNFTQGAAGPRAVDIATSASDTLGNSFNRIEYCFVSGGRTCIGFAGTTANPNSNNVIWRNQLTDFSFAGVWLFSNTLNTTVEGNEFFHTAGFNVANSAINMSASGCLGINDIVLNKFYDLQNTSTSTLRGITGIPGDGSTLNIINNFFSLTQNNGTKTSIYAIQISGTTTHTANIYYNSFRIGGTHTGGTAGVIISGGLIKSNTGAGATFNAENNISINNRTGGTAGAFHTNFFVGATGLVGTLDIDYNVNYADGGASSFHAGWSGTLYNDLTQYRTAATPHEQNTIFKNANYVSNTDLHLTGLSVGDADLAGTPLAGILSDIDGDTRDLTNPYRGADEADVPFLPVLAPTNLVASADTFTVSLGWQDNSNNEGGFIIQRKDGDSLSVNPFVSIDTVSTNINSLFDTGLNPNTTYTYRVYAINALGQSGFSNMAQVTTIIPVELTSFIASVSDRNILIDWVTATELNNQGFDIQRKLGGEWEKVAFVDGNGTTTEESAYSFVDKFTYKSFKGIITYRLKQMDFDGTYEYSPEVEVDVDFTPKEYTLYQNYPNPFNPATTIKYSLPFDSKVRIVVYSILGEMLDVAVDEIKAAGFHDYNWNAGSHFASGVYLYSIEAQAVSGEKSYSSVKKMMLVK